MKKVLPIFVGPRNGEKVSDPIYWFLRSVQNIFEVGEPPGLRLMPPTIELLDLKEPYRQDRINIKQVLQWPAADNVFENHLIIIDDDGYRIHLIRGGRLNTGKTFYIEDDLIYSAAVGSDSLYILTSKGSLIQVGISQLNSKVESGGSPPVSLRVLDILEIKKAYEFLSDAAPMMACPITAKKDTVVLIDNCLNNVVLIENRGGVLHRREVALVVSRQQRDSLQITRIISFDSRVILFDSGGFRLYFLDPFEKNPKLKIFSGDGYGTKRGVGFGPVAADGRLAKASSICYFKLTKTRAELVAGCTRFNSGYKDVTVPTDSVEVDRLKTEILYRSGFMVFFDPQVGSVFTCSPFPHEMSKKYFSSAPTLMLPLYAPQIDAALKIPDPLFELHGAIKGFTEVSQGPDSSIMFWAPGESKVLLLHSIGLVFNSILNNHVHMDEVNKLLGRRMRANASEF